MIDNKLPAFLVSEDIRRANSKAIRMRNRWRERYSVLSDAIRTTKRRLAAAHRNHSIDRLAEVELFALRLTADYMMFTREDIKQQLRLTAYSYADSTEEIAA